jgi:hypothetical protein
MEEDYYSDEARLKRLYNELPEVDVSGHGRNTWFGRDSDEIRAEIDRIQRRIGIPQYHSEIDFEG